MTQTHSSRNLTLFSWISFLRGLYFFTPILTLFLAGHGVSLAAIVIANMFWSFGAFLGEVPTGIFADHFGQKLSILCGYVAVVISVLILLSFPTAIGLYIYCALGGLAYAFLSGSEEALLYETVRHLGRQDYQKLYGRLLSNEQLGYVVATALAGLIYQFGGTQTFPFLIVITAAAFVLASLFASLLTNYKTDPIEGSEGKKMFETLSESFALIRGNKTIFTLTIVSILTISGEYLLQAVYPPYFEAHAVSALWIGLVMSFGTLLNVLVMRNVHRLEDRFSLEKILLGLTLIQGTLFVLMSILVHPVFLVCMFIVLQGVFNVQNPVISDYINPRVHSDIRATVLSGISFAKRFFELFFALALGAVVKWFGIGPTLAFQGFYLLIGIAIGYYLLVRCGCTYKVNKPNPTELTFG